MVPSRKHGAHPLAFYQLINHDKRFVALFSPKCGCTTLKRWFAESLEQGRIGRGQPDGQPDGQALNVHRIPVAAIADHPDYLKLLFVRSPYERLVSFYCSFIVRYVELWGFADADKKVDLRGRTFAELLRILAALQRDAIPFQHHLEPQLQGLESVVPDRVVRVADLDDELPAISRALGFDYAPRRLNATRYTSALEQPVQHRSPDWLREHGMPSYRYFFDATLLEIVSQLYARDAECYGLRPGENPFPAAEV